MLYLAIFMASAAYIQKYYLIFIAIGLLLWYHIRPLL